MTSRRKPGPPSRRPTAAMVAVIALGAGVAGWGAVSALAERLRAHPAIAIAAKTVMMREVLHASDVISHQGNSLVNERGRGTGTYTCPVVVHFRVSYTTGTITLTCITNSGNVTGGGTVSYFTAGGVATFTGNRVSVMSGTGKYAHARGQLSVEGTMVRKTFAVVAYVRGPITY
jgi:hypothetical protein